MSAGAKMDCVVLFEDEIRIAAKAIEHACDLKDASDQARQDAWSEAMEACMVALAGAERDDAALMMASRASLLSRAKVGP